MGQSTPGSNREKGFVAGLLLVPALHIAFLILWFIVSYLILITSIIPYFSRDYNFILLGFPLFFLSVSQLTYLIPACVYFARRRRREVCKGIICGGLITGLVNSTCFASMGGGGGIQIPIVVTIVTTLIIMVAGFWFVNQQPRG